MPIHTMHRGLVRKKRRFVLSFCGNHLTFQPLYATNNIISLVYADILMSNSQVPNMSNMVVISIFSHLTIVQMNLLVYFISL
jgi:hypothetical protein